MACGSNLSGHWPERVEGAVGRVFDALDERLVEQLHDRALAEAVEIPKPSLSGVDRTVHETRARKRRFPGEVLLDIPTSMLYVINS